jgi:hypothetical protein
MDGSKSVCTPMVTGYKLNKDDDSPKANQIKYRSIIGGMIYLTTTKLDIMHVVCLVAIFQEDPKETHVATFKRIFRYLNGISNYGLWYLMDTNFTLSDYIDVDWEFFVDDIKCTSGGAFFIGCRLVSWLIEKKDSISLSIIEAKYIIVASCCA